MSQSVKVLASPTILSAANDNFRLRLVVNNDRASLNIPLSLNTDRLGRVTTWAARQSTTGARRTSLLTWVRMWSSPLGQLRLFAPAVLPAS